VPVSQILPPATVKNIGLATQTNIVLSAKINEAPVGTSAPLASLAPGETAGLTLTPAVNVPQGENTMTYTITQSQLDENPDNNVCTFTYKGTQNIFAVDDVTNCSNGTGSYAGEFTFGHIFNINQAVTISQVIIGFGDAYPLDYSVSLYSMTGDLTTAATPLFTQPATRDATGFSFVTVPATLLATGNYFLCVNQLSYENIMVSYDANYSKTTYSRAANGALSGMSVTLGAVAIRMVLQVTNCAAQPPVSLNVVPSHTTATFTWGGTTPLYFLLKLNDGTNERTFITTNNTLTVSGLEVGTSYTWRVAAMCDAIHGEETVGQPFTTLNCSLVTLFPFKEGFEAEEFPPACWSVFNIAGGETTWAHSGFCHTGEASAVHNYELGVQEGWLVTPQIEIPNSGNFILEFWSANTWADYYHYNGVWVSTEGDDPSTAPFTEIKQLTGSEISENWKKIRLNLSDNYAGKNIYIGFKYTSDYDYADGWYIDDVDIWDFSNYVEGELATIIAPNSGEGLTASEEVKVLIKNNGSDPLTGFKLKLELDGTLIVTEIYTASIASMGEAEYTFNTKLNLSELGTYTIKITLEVADDQIPENNSKTKKIAGFSPKIVKLLGYRVFDFVQEPYSGFISFYSNNPNDVTQVSDYMPAQSNTDLYSGEYLDGYFYSYSVTAAATIIPRNFIKIFTKTWTDILVQPVTAMPRDMAYDYKTGVMYGIVGASTAVSNLVTINLATGEMTTISTLGRLAMTLACSPEGNLFIIDADGNLCAVNKTTAEVNVIGSTGIIPYYVQSMAFDQKTGRLFWAMCNAKDEGRLVELDPATGVGFDRGAIGGEAELIGLYTIEIEDRIADTEPPANFTLYPNPAKDLLKIVRTTADKAQVEIYNLIGIKVQSFEMNGPEAEINVARLPSGVYLVRVVSGQTVSVKRFVKE
jgi:hypothetical protein